MPIHVIVLIGIGVVAAIAVGFWMGWESRQTHNIDLYLDEQHKRVKAENEALQLARDMEICERALARSQTAEFEKGVIADRLLDEVARLQRIIMRRDEIYAPTAAESVGA